MHMPVPRINPRINPKKEKTVMPFGLSPACWVFTKLTNELVGRWRSHGIKLVHYLDDFLFAVAGDATGEHSLFKSVQQRVLSDIQAAGFSLSIPKLVLEPEVYQVSGLHR